MSGCRADRGREAVYAAEEAAVGGTDLDDRRSLADLRRVAAEVVDGVWWRSCRGPAVAVGGARADALSSRAVQGRGRVPGPVEVRLAELQQTSATLAHELAHALVGVERGHDERFRAAHVDVLAVLAGAGPAGALASSYARLGVAPGRRRWPSPVRAEGPGFVIVP